MPRVSPILHRNSQKRIYRKGAVYFITSVTFERHPYFNEEVLADLFAHNLWLSKHLKEFELFGYVVLPDHVHVMLQPQGEKNYSEVMQNIKRVFSLQANQIMFSHDWSMNAGDDIYRHLPTQKNDPYGTLQWSNLLNELHNRLINKHGANHLLPKFKWQKSFRDHLIRGRRDFENHLAYIRNNAVKHGLVEKPEEWPWMWVLGRDRPEQ